MLKQEGLTHCPWALCWVMCRRHISTALLGEYQGTGGVGPQQCLCVAKTCVTMAWGLCSPEQWDWPEQKTPVEKSLPMVSGCCVLQLMGGKLEGAMETLWQSQGRAGSGEYGVGGEAGSHLNTESGVFRSPPVFWSTVISVINLSARHWPEEVSSSNQDILLSVNWIKQLWVSKEQRKGLICSHFCKYCCGYSATVPAEYARIQCTVWNCFLAGTDDLWDHK